jgi:hypothetical protein
MIKHSDAPWKPGKANGRYYVYDANDCTVCTVARWAPLVDKTDASLIAAAPDMLAALIVCEDVLSRAPLSTQLWPDGTHPNTGIALIRATIAKAEGRS